MADNVTLSIGTADGAVIATDDITGVHYQIFKLIIGALDAGTLLSGNSGNKDAGTIRVVLATDQPALTNKLLVTPDSVALPANQSVNAAQINGVTPLMGAGNTGTGSIRVTIATDQAQLTNKLLVTPDSVALPANQSVNVAQINGVTTLMGNGATGTGSQRVTIASDNTAFSVNSTLKPATSGGYTTFMASGSDGSSILVATKQTIKASAGQLYGWYAYNPEAAVTFVHFYNTDTVTVGTTNPQMTLAIPGGAAANVFTDTGIPFSTAISCAATTTAGGNTAPATGVSLVAFYA